MTRFSNKYRIAALNQGFNFNGARTLPTKHQPQPQPLQTAGAQLARFKWKTQSVLFRSFEIQEILFRSICKFQQILVVVVILNFTLEITLFLTGTRFVLHVKPSRAHARTPLATHPLNKDFFMNRKPYAKLQSLSTFCFMHMFQLPMLSYCIAIAGTVLHPRIKVNV